MSRPRSDRAARSRFRPCCSPDSHCRSFYAHHERVAQFYESLGFRRIPGSLLLVHKTTDIAATLRTPV